MCMRVCQPHVRLEACSAALPAAFACSTQPLTRADTSPLCREVRWAALLQRQQRFLLPAVGLLSNLAEEPGAQRKMVKRVSSAGGEGWGDAAVALYVCCCARQCGPLTLWSPLARRSCLRCWWRC